MMRSIRNKILFMLFCMLTLTMIYSKGTKANADVTVDTILSNELNGPSGIAVDSEGNLYIADTNNNAIKKVDASGKVTTLLSSGLNKPSGVAVDSKGNVYIADTDNRKVKKLNTSGEVTTLVSTGLSKPSGVAVDNAGNVYIADTVNDKIKKLDLSAKVTTFTDEVDDPTGVAVDSNGNVYIVDKGNCKVYKFDASGNETFSIALDDRQMPSGVAVDSAGNVYYADTYSDTIYKIDSEGAVTTLVSSILSNPSGLVFDSTGNMYIADTGNNQIKRLTPSGEVTTLVSSSLKSPYGVAVDNAGNVYIADTGNNEIKKQDSSGKVTALVSSGLFYPQGVAVDSKGNVYIANSDDKEIKKMDSSGKVTTLVSSLLDSPNGITVDSIGNVYITIPTADEIIKMDSSGKVATEVTSGLSQPSGLAVDSSGNVYIADTDNNAIKMLDTQGYMTTLVSSGLNAPMGIAVDSRGNVYIAERGNNAIKIWDKSGKNVTTLVSSGLNAPTGVAVDSTGNVYIVDTNNNAIKKITAPAVPTVNRAGGTILSGTQVSLSCATKGAEIYYTEDGSTPTTSSTHYTVPITISHAETIKAIAVLNGVIESNVMTENYTLMYAINAQSANPSLGTVDVGQNALGAEASVTAKPRRGNRFDKWTSDVEGKTVVSTEKTIKVTVDNSSVYYAWFTPDTYTITVGGNDPLGGTVTGINTNGYSYNAVTTLTAVANQGYTFDGWKNEYGVTISTASSIAYRVTGNMTITPVFTPNIENTTYYKAVFYHQSGNLLKSEKVAKNGTVTPPNTPSKTGYDFMGWSTDGTNAVTLNPDGSITITSDMRFRPLFKVKEVSYSLTVNGVSNAYSPLSSVTAQIAQEDIPEGKQFQYWADAAGKVVSYSNPYSFSITGDVTLTAIYENSTVNVIKEPTLTLSDATYEVVNEGKHKMLWYAAMDLPKGYTLVESGILRVVSNTPQADEQMTFDTTGIYRRIIEVSASIPNQYYYSVTASVGKGVSIRAYIVVRNQDGNLETIYSEVQYGCIQ